jgi:hypothetical protein
MKGLGGSTAHEVANAFYGTVNRGVRVRSACADADGAGGLQRDGHRTDNGVARPVAFVRSQDDSDAADMLNVPGQRCEHSILGIGASLRVNRFVFGDNLDTHRFHRNKGKGRFEAPTMCST